MTTLRVVQLQNQNKRSERLILAEITDAPVPSKFPNTFLVLFCHNGHAFRIPCTKDTNLKEILGGMAYCCQLVALFGKRSRQHNRGDAHEIDADGYVGLMGNANGR